MGNRGVLHDALGKLKRPWQIRRWLICVLEFRGRHRRVMTPGNYTELFFLDEATALAAGHRPCAECRRDRFNDFRRAWPVADSDRSKLPTADEMDRRLHAERVHLDRTKQCFLANVDELPNGVIFRYPAECEDSFIIWNDKLFQWTAGGYTCVINRPKNVKCLVLNPKSTVETIRAGYVPQIHPSATAHVNESSLKVN